jgi:hypothetical protein
MNESVLSTLVIEIEKNRNTAGYYAAMKNTKLANKYEHIAAGLEEAHRIIVNEMAVNA